MIVELFGASGGRRYHWEAQHFIILTYFSMSISYWLFTHRKGRQLSICQVGSHSSNRFFKCLFDLSLDIAHHRLRVSGPLGGRSICFIGPLRVLRLTVSHYVYALPFWANVPLPLCRQLYHIKFVSLTSILMVFGAKCSGHIWDVIFHLKVLLPLQTLDVQVFIV